LCANLLQILPIKDQLQVSQRHLLMVVTISALPTFVLSAAKATFGIHYL